MKRIILQIWLIGLIAFSIVHGQTPAITSFSPTSGPLGSRPEKWTYSCAPDYFGLRLGTLPDKSVVLSQFRSVSEFRSFIEDSSEGFDYEALF